ncbi:hypothetical protein TNCV_2187471 [Trichonephila clavipes]|nr:hypothetical protein TNCV_2187471 [Trichonephila clavipes]
MSKKQTCITCTAVQMVTAELRYECITCSFLIDECRITECFSGYINNMKRVHSTSPDMMLVDEELYAVQDWKKSILNVAVDRPESSTRAVAHQV